MDGGGKEGKLSVVVNVLDVNDNRPVFDKSIYQVSVHNNFPLEGVVGFVHASDADEEDNANLAYSSTTKQGQCNYNADIRFYINPFQTVRWQ